MGFCDCLLQFLFDWALREKQDAARRSATDSSLQKSRNPNTALESQSSSRQCPAPQ
jgi:hypothetical protein